MAMYPNGSPYPDDVVLKWTALMRAGKYDEANKLATPYDREKPNYAPNELGGYRKGGPVKKTGPANVHKGETVVKKSSTTKYGPAKMAAVNKGTAKVSMKRGRR